VPLDLFTTTTRFLLKYNASQKMIPETIEKLTIQRSWLVRVKLLPAIVMTWSVNKFSSRLELLNELSQPRGASLQPPRWQSLLTPELW